MALEKKLIPNLNAVLIFRNVVLTDQWNADQKTGIIFLHRFQGQNSMVVRGGKPQIREAPETRAANSKRINQTAPLN